MPATSFAYAKIVVKDSGALPPFYTGALGLSVARRVEEGEGAHAFVETFLSVSGGTPQLALISYPHQPAPAAGEAILALYVDDVDATLAAIEKAGGHITLPAFTIAEHRLRMACAIDPEGHTIELMKLG